MIFRRRLSRAATSGMAAVFTAAVALAASIAPAQSRHEANSATLSRLSEKPAARPTPDNSAPDLKKTARSIVEQTNDFRSKHGLSPVTTNSALTAAADYFAHYMAETDKYGHTADGNEPIDRARQHGYEPCIVAENIAWIYDSQPLATRALTERFITGWKHSPEHRRNMLDPDVTETAVAVAHSPKTDHFYAVQMFGRPKSLSLHVRLANQSNATVEYELGGERFSLPSQYIREHELCRPTEVVFHASDHDAQRPAETIPIKRDASFTIESSATGRPRLQRDTAAPGQSPAR